MLWKFWNCFQGPILIVEEFTCWKKSTHYWFLSDGEEFNKCDWIGVSETHQICAYNMLLFADAILWLLVGCSLWLRVAGALCCADYCGCLVTAQLAHCSGYCSVELLTGCRGIYVISPEGRSAWLPHHRLVSCSVPFESTRLGAVATHCAPHCWQLFLVPPVFPWISLWLAVISWVVVQALKECGPGNSCVVAGLSYCGWEVLLPSNVYILLNTV